MKHARKITEEQELELIAMHAGGSTRKELAEKFGLHVSGVQSVLWRHGVRSRQTGQGRKPRFDVQQMITEYNSGKSLQEIAETRGLNNSSVWAYLKRAGVQCRPAGFQRGEDHHEWKGGVIINTSGYEMVRIYEDHPFFGMAVKKANGASYVLRHRLVKALQLGRPLRDDESVHHIDGNKLNNDPTNLQLRQYKHGKGVSFCCADCGSRNIVAEELN